MRIGGGEERFAVDRRDCAGPAVKIEKSFVKVTNFNRIEAIDLLDETPA